MKPKNRFRILVVDDNPAIHEDFRKILDMGNSATSKADNILDAFLSDPAQSRESGESAGGFEPKNFEIVSAHQGQEALELIEQSLLEGNPFSLAFVDVRMPPGWDGVQTLEKIFAIEKDIQAVICTAYSDYSYEEMMSTLGASERLLILKKPFDPIEVQQLANAMVEKWQLALSNRERLEEVRAYAASLETVNRALTSDKAMAVAYSRSRTDFVVDAGKALASPLQALRSSPELAANLMPFVSELELIVAQMSRLAELEGGLQCSSLEEGACRPHFEAPLEHARAFAAERGVEFKVTGLEDLPDLANLDGAMVEELITHLFEGAIDVCPAASVSAEIGFENDPGSSGAPLRIAVTIDGLELDPTGKAAVFEPFENNTTSLHLSLARQLARLLRWELFGESNGPNSSRLILRAKIDTGAPPGGLLAAA